MELEAFQLEANREKSRRAIDNKQPDPAFQRFSVRKRKANPKWSQTVTVIPIASSVGEFEMLAL